MKSRKYLFCADSIGADFLYDAAKNAIEDKITYDFHVIEDEEDAFISTWFSRQRMGTQLYISGKNEFVKRIEHLAFAAGFSEQEMRMNICGLVKKKLICSKCHGINEVEEEREINCNHCGINLEVSSHYSRRLDAYLGYVTIK